MEATGVYWKPVWHMLEADFEMVLANPQHIRNVPGRKTDVKDAAWISDLLAHGLIRRSFVPPENVQQLRDLTRTRRQLVSAVSQHSQRIQKTLENANIKVASLLSDMLGMSGRRILDAITKGQSDPARLAELVDDRVKAKPEMLIAALNGRITDQHRFQIGLHLRLIDAIRQEIREIDSRIEQEFECFREASRLVKTIPGVSRITGDVILAEIGIDMTRFPTAGHLISWAGLCPRNDESAGKRRSTRVRMGASWLKPALVQAAWAAARTKNARFRSMFHRIKARRGPKKAIVAVAADILRAVYHMLLHQKPYHELGPDYLQPANPARAAQRLIQRLTSFGYTVSVERIDTASAGVSP